MTPFPSSLFWALTVCDIHFSVWELPKLPLCSAKYLSFGGVSFEIRTLSRSIQETYTFRKVKKNTCYFFFRVENQIRLISWSTFSCSIMLFCIRFKLRFWNFRPIFLRMPFSLVVTCFHYFWLSVWVGIYILNILMSF